MPADKNKNFWLQIGLKMFVESTGWIAMPVVGALFLGRWLDNKYNSQPIFFLGLTILAFIISSVGIGITGVKYIKLLEKEEKEAKDSKKEDNKQPANKEK